MPEPTPGPGEPLDGRCDLFALGCVLYQLGTGRLPFPGADTLAVLRALDEPPPPSAVNPDVPPGPSDLIVRLLAKRAADRPRTAGEVEAALAAIERDPTAPGRRRSRGRRAPAAALLVVPLSFLVAPVPVRDRESPSEGERAAPGRAWPIDSLRRTRIPPYELAGAGGGDPANAPDGLVAILGDSRLKHWDTVHSVAFSPDGKVLASGGFDHVVKLWDPDTGKELRTLVGHPTEVQCVAFDASGELLASVSRDGTVRLWESATGKDRGTIRTGHTKHVNRLALSRDGTALVTVGWDGLVKCREAGTGKDRWSVSLGTPDGRAETDRTDRRSPTRPTTGTSPSGMPPPAPSGPHSGLPTRTDRSVSRTVPTAASSRRGGATGRWASGKHRVGRELFPCPATGG